MLDMITDETEVQELAEKLRPLIGSGTILRLDNDSFSAMEGRVVDILAEWEDADPADDIEERAEACDIDLPDAMPFELLSALALLLGFKTEHC